jgi:hypothetical protein
MEVKIEKGSLVIRIPMCEPRPSGSGKTMVVATTSGNVVTTCEHPTLKKPIKIGLNAYCAKGD